MSTTMNPTRIVAVTDEQTAIGLRLTGISEAIAATPSNAETLLRGFAADPEVAVIIVTEHIAEANFELIQRLTRETFPIVVEIPDKDGPITRLKDPIRELVLQAVGVDLG